MSWEQVLKKLLDDLLNVIQVYSKPQIALPGLQPPEHVDYNSPHMSSGIEVGSMFEHAAWDIKDIG